MADTLKAHPEYSRGYFAALDGEPCSGGSIEYQTGYSKGKEAVAIFAEHGFKKSGRSFSVTLSADLTRSSDGGEGE